MKTLFIVLAFIGMFACGFFFCLVLVFALMLNEYGKSNRRVKPRKESKHENKDLVH